MFIKGVATYFPSKAVSNEEIIQGDSHWDAAKVFDKLGIQSRYVAQDECVSDLAVGACESLFKSHEGLREQIDALIICTQSPDFLLPTTACLVQSSLKLGSHVAAFDINLGCSGYIYGLAVCKGLIAGGVIKNALLVTADLYTKHLDSTDISNKLIFGDGASATWISSEYSGGSLKIENFTLGTDGSGGKNLVSKLGGMASLSDRAFLYMNGPAVFNFTSKEVPGLIAKNLDAAGLSLQSVDYFILHQANKFMLESLRKKIGIVEEKWLTSFENYGNTVSSTIPIVLHDKWSEVTRNGSKTQLVGFGVGYSWGAVVVEAV